MKVKLKGFKIHVEAGELEYELGNPQDAMQLQTLIKAVNDLKEFKEKVENGEVKAKNEDEK